MGSGRTLSPSPLTWGPRRGRGGTGSGRTLSPSWVRRGEDGGPDGRAHMSVRKEGKKAQSRLGREIGRRVREKGRGKVFLGRGVKDKKRWAGGEKEKVLHFSETVQTLSI